jgi:Icc-related predicted phosphoesterase
MPSERRHAVKLFRSRSAGTESLRLYYASDIHGADVCWRKFLGAAEHYGADATMLGGDLTGKAIVPISETGASFTAVFMGEEWHGSTPIELEQLEAAIRFNGMYPWLAQSSEVDRHRSDAAAQAELFDRVIISELQRWVDLADQRMVARRIPIFVIPGNDDLWACDAVLRNSTSLTFADDCVIPWEGHEVLSLSYSNLTPWKSRRELDEDSLYHRLRALADQLENPEAAIFNLHVPPYDTGIDAACEVNPEDLSLVYASGKPHIIPVGSRAVRQVIEEVQPMLSLHGHVHESRGEARLGRTLALNAGSEYNSGHLQGVLVSIAGTQVKSHQFVVG